MKGVRIAYRSSLTYPDAAGGAGRKGGTKRKQRIYVNNPDMPTAAKNVNNAPFSEIWHNNEPLRVINVREIPEARNRCGQCSGEFPRGILSIVPYDIALSHKERWKYYNNEKKEYLPSPHGKTTTKFYCIKGDCILKRFPYFREELLEISDSVELKDSHKKLLRDELQLSAI